MGLIDNPFNPKEVKLVNYNPSVYENNKVDDINNRKIKMYENRINGLSGEAPKPLPSSLPNNSLNSSMPSSIGNTPNINQPSMNQPMSPNMNQSMNPSMNHSSINSQNHGMNMGNRPGNMPRMGNGFRNN